MTAVLAVHLDCYPKSATCIEYAFAKNNEKKMLLSTKESFAFSEKNVIEASIYSDERNHEVLNLVLNSEGTVAYADLTKHNILKRAALVLDGKIETAPVIQAEIKEGRMQITFGREKSSGSSRDQLIKRLPWLKKLTAKH